MDLTPYVDAVRTDLTSLAEAAPEPARDTVARLVTALDPSVRLALLSALTEAAAEITTQVPSGSVEVRLRGRDAEFVVDVPPPAPEAESEPYAAGSPGGYAAPAAVGADGTGRAGEGADDPDVDEGDVVRITVRIPASVKARAEEMAAGTGRSLNAWIVTALRTATRDEGWTVDLAQFAGDLARAAASAKQGRHMSGWL